MPRLALTGKSEPPLSSCTSFEGAEQRRTGIEVERGRNRSRVEVARQAAIERAGWIQEGCASDSSESLLMSGEWMPLLGRSGGENRLSLRAHSHVGQLLQFPVTQFCESRTGRNPPSRNIAFETVLAKKCESSCLKSTSRTIGQVAGFSACPPCLDSRPRTR